MSGRSDPESKTPPDTQRADKWLWQARLYKSRSLAAREVMNGRLRINGVRASRPAAPVRPGDVLTLARAGRVDVLRVEALAQRRGPATEARLLYSEIAPEAGSGAQG